MPKKRNRIWTKDLLRETKAGQILTPFIILAVVFFISWQAFSGIVLGEAVAVNKFGQSYTYLGDNARLIGMAYLCVFLFGVSVCFHRFIRNHTLRSLHTAFLFLIIVSFIAFLSIAIYREAF